MHTESGHRALDLRQYNTVGLVSLARRSHFTLLHRAKTAFSRISKMVTTYTNREQTRQKREVPHILSLTVSQHILEELVRSNNPAFIGPHFVNVAKSLGSIVPRGL